MRTVLTHPWGTKHRPNLLHRSGLTQADEGPELSFCVVQFSGQAQKGQTSTADRIQIRGHSKKLAELRLAA